MCLTPHFHPGYFGNNRSKTDAAFDKLREYAREKYKDLQLYLGNELRYSDGCMSWMAENACRTLNGSRYVLVDFSTVEDRQRILRGLNQLRNAGYTPVLAHAERYRNFHGDFREIRYLRDRDVVIQMDAGSVFGVFGFWTKLRSRAMLKQGMVDVVSSDAHGLESRVPMMEKCADFLRKKYGSEYAQDLCWNHAVRILNDEAI